jgi:hypothetical protein
MRPSLRGRVRAWWAAFALAALFACASPTLPLPPPTAPTISGETNDTTATLIHLEGANAEPNAIIVVVNVSGRIDDDQAVAGGFVKRDGTWGAYIPALKHDVLEITPEIGTTRSPPTTVRVP